MLQTLRNQDNSCADRFIAISVAKDSGQWVVLAQKLLKYAHLTETLTDKEYLDICKRLGKHGMRSE